MANKICLIITTCKAGVFMDVTPVVALTDAIKGTKYEELYDKIARLIRVEGVYIDSTHPHKNVIFTRKPMKRKVAGV